MSVNDDLTIMHRRQGGPFGRRPVYLIGNSFGYHVVAVLSGRKMQYDFSFYVNSCSLINYGENWKIFLSLEDV